MPRMMLVGVRVHARPWRGDIVEVRLTVPVKPSKADTTIVDVPVLPALAVTLVGSAEVAKSWTVYTTAAAWSNGRLVPVTVTL